MRARRSSGAKALRIYLAIAALALPSALSAQTRAGVDVPGKTASGVSFTQPKDWAVTSRQAVTVLAAPESDLSIVVVDVADAASAEAAAAKAWSLYKPNASRRVRLASPLPTRDGWDERVGFEYETSPSERAVVSAMAMRKGALWTVAITDGADATMNKRAAAAEIIERSLRPDTGYVARELRRSRPPTA